MRSGVTHTGRSSGEFIGDVAGNHRGRASGKAQSRLEGKSTTIGSLQLVEKDLIPW
jgi:hypothetical protein